MTAQQTNTYRIVDAGQAESILATRGEIDHRTVAAAVDALRGVLSDMDAAVADHVDGGGWLVYRSQADVDAAYATGSTSAAVARIEEVRPSV